MFPEGEVVMQKLFNFLMVGLTFVVLNVATVAAEDPLESNTSAEQQGEMSDFANATDGGTMSAAATAGAAKEESDRKSGKVMCLNYYKTYEGDGEELCKDPKVLEDYRRYCEENPGTKDC